MGQTVITMRRRQEAEEEPKREQGAQTIKCELVYWQRENRLKELIEQAQAEARAERKREKRLKTAFTAAAAAAVILAAAAAAGMRANTAAQASAAMLTEYEERFNNAADIAQRLTIAAEVNRIFGNVKSGDLPEENAEFVESCRIIDGRLGGAENE